MNNITKVTECRICDNPKLQTFLSLGPMPLANSFLKKEQLSEPEPYYPLDVCFCSSCGLVQLGQVVSPETMFCDYAYLTGTSSPMKTHFMDLARSVTKQFKPASDHFVIDIGSNDGLLLECFKTLGLSVLGIEPAQNVAQIAQNRGIDTICNWFTDSLAERIKSERITPDAILATNVFAHVHDVKGFVKNVKRLMNKDTIFIIEVPYLVDMLNKTEFDTIYHEHLSYFSISPLIKLFSLFNMSIVEVEYISTHGGSLRIYVKKTASISPNVNGLWEIEQKLKLLTLDPYELFANNVYGIKSRLTSLLASLKEGGYHISGYGAPAKSTTLLNYCQIGAETLDYITDTTPTKQGHYTPGTHIPIYPENYFRKYPPDYNLLLAWNYATNIITKEVAFQKNGGRFITPIPNPQIVAGILTKL